MYILNKSNYMVKILIPINKLISWVEKHPLIYKIFRFCYKHPIVSAFVIGIENKVGEKVIDHDWYWKNTGYN